MEQLEQPLIVVKLLQGRHGRVAEAGIGLRNHALQIGIGNGPANERVHDGEGHILIAPPLEMGELPGRELGPCGGHVKAAIACQASQENVFETEFRGLAPGRNIAQGRAPSRM